MSKLTSPAGEPLLCIQDIQLDSLHIPSQSALYRVFLLEEGSGVFHADMGSFSFTAPVLLFSTPLQVVYAICPSANGRVLQFSGDFYCIEYHKAQVACNGLLFNNIYLDPSIALTAEELKAFKKILDDLGQELKHPSQDETVLQSYLQLFLAKSSSIKTQMISAGKEHPEKDEQMEQFVQLLEKNYLKLHKPSDYADLLAMSPKNFSKRCIRYFHKTPSTLIQERLILEAKKKLHLTRQSIKEISYSLNFDDESYFSRFFKKFTKYSPQAYRDKTGISIVADMQP